MGDNNVLIESHFDDLQLVKRGKVRDVYEIDGKLLIVASDRISAFDVVMDDPVPDKGKILTKISLFWFEHLKSIVENHVISAKPSEYPAPCNKYHQELQGRSMLVKKAIPLPVECVVRGYLSGSGWLEYQSTGTICGIPLPEGLSESEQLPAPIFTPSTKAEHGIHDENISFERVIDLVGEETARKIRDLSIQIYNFGREFAADRGIIIADTKFEFGMSDSRLILIDEVLTPDSSRFWPMDSYQPGGPQESFDKQFLRDYLNGLDWPKKPPPPKLPPDIIEKTRERYVEALRRLTGSGLEEN
ncbi:MAG: phosphoribosylaminoimidazolesuccinocarboxamide synthase [Deltaproteobacteria bacterium]|nr:phosphoribosylaminoimidazolesuccinocarboxamide synthase [Deltaproteobacteria bacterium]MBW1934713.1 phosphoribosylaminoimidazolesuccinocarboxamide synthase [Deltaproteobacteria bacterium]MBW1976960.1 phosphoribosylaminoimidazolesuccinocarboxamide synthase [Deltaproteobacteria bacterium]MBW2044692.1 phosphoribosylaminoimidazolesuccinocarboxamide synthase [Deltaproteobacteria bacterium]MBW2300118.1 phosphoribosylaminoimidazolesuccinocarboxamide synthase [Deltaproteobacteria bacterium]